MVEFRQLPGLLQIVGFRRRLGGAGDDPFARQGVVLHLGVFLVGELARLVQQGVGHLDLAHVVEGRGLHHGVDILVGQHVRMHALPAHLLHDDAGVSRRLLDVVAGVLVPALDHVRQHGDQAVLLR